MPATPPAPALDSFEGRLREILAQARFAQARGDLPDLGAAPSEAPEPWFSRLARWLAQRLRSHWDFSPASIEATLQAALWSLAAVAAAVAIVFVYRFLTSRLRATSAPRDPFSVGPRARAPAAVAIEKMERALAAGRFAEALRWRWRVRLAELSLSPSATPLELAAARHRPAPSLDQPYRAMFGGGPATRRDFEDGAAVFQTLGLPERSGGESSLALGEGGLR